MKKTKSNKLEIFEKTGNKLLELTGVNARGKATFDETNQAYVLDIDAGEETGLLIGRHGETLNAMQTILGLLFKQEVGEWLRVVINVGDWREKQEERLRELALGASQRAVQTGEPQPIYNLTPAQRRVIHLTLAESGEVETESVGEGEERYLVIKPKGK